MAVGAGLGIRVSVLLLHLTGVGVANTCRLFESMSGYRLYSVGRSSDQLTVIMTSFSLRGVASVLLQEPRPFTTCCSALGGPSHRGEVWHQPTPCCWSRPLLQGLRRWGGPDSVQRSPGI